MFKNRNFIYWQQGFSLDQLGNPFGAHSQSPDATLMSPEESDAKAAEIFGQLNTSSSLTPEQSDAKAAEIFGNSPDSSSTSSASQQPQTQPSAFDKFFGNPIQNAAIEAHNKNLQPGEQPAQFSNPVSALGETAKNVGSFALDAMNPENSPLAQFNKSHGISSPITDAGAQAFHQASQAIGGKGGNQVIPAINQAPKTIGGDLHDIMTAGQNATSFQDALQKGDLAKNKLIQDTLGAVFAPANVLPETAKQGFSSVMNGVKNGISSGVQSMGIDPNSQQGKDIVESLNNIFQLGLLAHGGQKEIPNEGANTFTSEDLSLANKELNQKYFDQRMQEAPPSSPPESIPSSPEQLSKNLLRSGMKENYVNGLSNLPPEMRDLATQYLDAGINKLKNPIEAPNVFDIPGKEVEDFIDKGTSTLKNLGQQLGEAKNNLSGQTIETPSIQTALNNVFNKLNIKQTTDGLDFSKSELQGAGAATSQLENIWNQVKEGKMDARDAEAITGQIDNITGQLKNSGFNTNTANRALSTVKTAINDALSKTDENFGQLNKQFAQLAQDLNQVKNATKVNLGGGKVEYNGQQLLRRVLGNAPGKYTEALDAMKRIEDTHGIEAPKNLQEKAFLADMAERYTGSNQPQSLQGAMEKAGSMVKKHAIESVPVVGKPANAFLDLIQSRNPENLKILENQANNVKDILTKEVKPGKVKGTFIITEKGLKGIAELTKLVTTKGIPKILPTAVKVSAGTKKK